MLRTYTNFMSELIWYHIAAKLQRFIEGGHSISLFQGKNMGIRNIESLSSARSAEKFLKVVVTKNRSIVFGDFLLSLSVRGRPESEVEGFFSFM